MPLLQDAITRQMRAGKEDRSWCPSEELIKRHVWRTRIRTSILRGGKRMAENILEVKHLKKYFKTARGTLHAVDDVSFTIEKGKTLELLESPDVENRRLDVRF